MLSQKGEQIVAADSPVATRRPVRRQQTLFDPIDNGAWIYVQEAADFVCCVNALVAFSGYHSGFRQHAARID